MGLPILWRKRFMPAEKVLLKDDIIIFVTEEHILTKWDTLKPRLDFQKGLSYYYLKEGYKISKFMKENGELVYFYCDIIDTIYDAEKNEYLFQDLLIDVIIYPDGRVQVVDIGEVAEALEEKLISVELAKKALRRLDELLELIYNKGIDSLICDEMR